MMWDQFGIDPQDVETRGSKKTRDAAAAPGRTRLTKEALAAHNKERRVVKKKTRALAYIWRLGEG